MVRPSFAWRLALGVLPLAMAACGALLPPREPLPEPWLPTYPLPDPGDDRSPLHPAH